MHVLLPALDGINDMIDSRRAWAWTQGMVRAEQDQRDDKSRGQVVGTLVHGDASFCGLGIVAECLQLSNVPG